MYYVSQGELNRSKIYMILQLGLDVIFIPCFFFMKAIEITIFIILSIVLWAILLNRIYIVISLYLREYNQQLYNKYRSARGVFGYDHLVVITVVRVKKKDYNEIQNKEIVELLKGAKRSHRTAIISAVCMFALQIIEFYR